MGAPRTMPLKSALLLLSLLALVLPSSLHRSLVAATALPDSADRQIAIGDGPFSDDSIQPPTPSDAIPSAYNLVQEVFAWSDLTVLFALLAREQPLLDAALSEDPILVFAPTNDAFLAVVRIFTDGIADDASTASIVAALDQIFGTLSTIMDGAPTLVDVLTYHIAGGDLTEQDIVDGSPLETFFGSSLFTEAYPLEIVDFDPTSNASRLARQIANSNGRISFIDEVLSPVNVADLLAGAGLLPSSGRQAVADDTDPLFRPFRSLTDFASSRNDLIVLTELVVMSPGLLEVLTTSPPLHVFGPTDGAFIALVSALGDEPFVAGILPEGGGGALGNRTELSAFASRLLSIWNAIEGLPTLQEVIAYHVLNTTSSFTELVGQGPQQTLFMSDDFDDEITIVEGAVQDADSTADSQLIASFATRSGFVSVIDAVLIPFTLEVAQDAFEMFVNPNGTMFPSPMATPTPRPSPSPFSAMALQPSIPDEAIDSTYNLVEELLAWEDASVLVALLADTPLRDAALSEDPFLVFAPTNEAFLAVLELLLSEPLEDPSTADIVDALNEVWSALNSTLPGIPTIPEVLSYHVVSGDLPEQEIVDMRSLETVFGLRLGTRRYPRVIFDEDRVTNSMRLGRQISNTNGRVSFINNVLLPINITAAMESGNLTIPVARQVMNSDVIDDVFRPLRSVTSFVASRNDLVVLGSLVLESEVLTTVLSNSPRLHVFGPNDSAFVALVEALVPEEAIDSIFDVDGDLDSILASRARKEQFATQLSMVWASLEGVPTLEEIVTYHVLNTSSSFEELVGEGPQDTLFSREGFASEISIIDGAVQDADATEDSPLIASFVTGTGFVSVIGGVLVPFTLEAGREAVLDLLDIPIRPSQSVTTAEPSPGEFDIIPIDESPGAAIPSLEPSPEEFDSTALQPSPSVVDPEAGTTDEDDEPVCFPSMARLQLASGTLVEIRDVEAGQDVHVGGGTVSPIFLFTHKQADVVRPFVRITTQTDHQVTLSGGHYIYANGRITVAKAVRVGDILETTDGKSVVVRTEMVRLPGLYAPHTIHGDLMVDGVRVSGYSKALHPRLAHALLAPIRLLVSFTHLKEPLGGLFYNGAENIARVLPSGSDRH
eukprot:GFKZ01014816.1.p1 GENE.GFKZ01014816.1~~GFKZ01014816.1.p1  ORF type:complete len:1116 (+),score=156.73 GFKZ01014816.1:281-3628(+)